MSVLCALCLTDLVDIVCRFGFLFSFHFPVLRFMSTYLIIAGRLVCSLPINLAQLNIQQSSSLFYSGSILLFFPSNEIIVRFFMFTSADSLSKCNELTLCYWNMITVKVLFFFIHLSVCFSFDYHLIRIIAWMRERNRE